MRLGPTPDMADSSSTLRFWSMYCKFLENKLSEAYSHHIFVPTFEGDDEYLTISSKHLELADRS